MSTPRRLPAARGGAGLALLVFCLAAAGCQPQAGRATAAGGADDYQVVRPPPLDRSDGSREGDAAAEAFDELPTGRGCVVQFRRDALGMAGAGVMGPTAATPPARAARLRGTLDQVTAHWLVLRTDDGRTFWLARHAVLLVEFPAEP